MTNPKDSQTWITWTDERTLVRYKGEVMVDIENGEHGSAAAVWELCDRLTALRSAADKLAEAAELASRVPACICKMIALAVPDVACNGDDAHANSTALVQWNDNVNTAIEASAAYRQLTQEP